jgi:hypothetical protein
MIACADAVSGLTLCNSPAASSAPMIPIASAAGSSGIPIPFRVPVNRSLAPSVSYRQAAVESRRSNVPRPGQGYSVKWFHPGHPRRVLFSPKRL